jgi:hypothetical protein
MSVTQRQVKLRQWIRVPSACAGQGTTTLVVKRIPQGRENDVKSSNKGTEKRKKARTGPTPA